MTVVAPFPDPEILTVEEVAAILRCSVDQARRIPRTELPAYVGPGKFVLYFREDVLRYLRNRPRKDEQRARLDGIRVRRRSRTVAADDNVHTFDPSHVRARIPRAGD